MTDIEQARKALNSWFNRKNKKSSPYAKRVKTIN